MAPTRDEMLAHAKARAESNSAPDEWGAELALEENGGSFVGFWAGEALDEAYSPPRVVYRLLDSDRAPRFMRHRFRLGQEVERTKPQPGDVVAIYRGEDYLTKDGNSGHSYGVETVAASVQELPAGVTAPIVPNPPAIDDIPF
jgi:hypothetical protein